MNKRIRKKKCIGEFKELAFSLEASYEKLTPENADEMVEKILDKVHDLNMTCGGTFDLDHFDLFVVTGRIHSDEEKRKSELTDFIKEIGIKDLKTGDFVDAWYSPIEHDEEECCCGHHHH